MVDFDAFKNFKCFAEQNKLFKTILNKSYIYCYSFMQEIRHRVNNMTKIIKFVMDQFRKY